MSKPLLASLVLSLSSTVLAGPRLVMPQSTLIDFGEIAIHERAERDVIFRNEGDAVLRLSFNGS